MKNEIKTFETALSRLEEIVKALESGSTPLDASIKLFEEGVSLSSYCSKLLRDAEQKVIMLTKNGDDIIEEPFAPLEEK